MGVALINTRFGPWRLVTWLSSGTKAPKFAHESQRRDQSTLLLARREALLNRSDARIIKDFGVQFPPSRWTISQEGFLPKLDEHTKDLDFGLGSARMLARPPLREFLKTDRTSLEETLRTQHHVAFRNIAH